MWTARNRGDYGRSVERYPSDVSDEEWALIEPHLPPLEAVIESHYPKVGSKGGRRPFRLAVMLRVYCLQQWYNLSGPGAEEAL
jgi:IS5 family transposase